jgi:phospholipid/cholesterol/gamma-HCH transport system permease protein
MRMVLEQIGNRVLTTVSNTFYAAGYFYEILKETARFIRRRHVRYGYRVLIMQILFTGVEALGLSLLFPCFRGSNHCPGSTILPQFGQGQLVYTILITVITRD